MAKYGIAVIVVALLAVFALAQSGTTKKAATPARPNTSAPTKVTGDGVRTVSAAVKSSRRKQDSPPNTPRSDSRFSISNRKSEIKKFLGALRVLGGKFLYCTPINCTSKISVEFAGITGG